MINKTQHTIDIIGAGLAGSEAALQLAQRGFTVRLFEMRPHHQTVVHQSGNCAELVCSNSLKSTKPDSAAGMLKQELTSLGSQVMRCAYENRVAAGGALAVDREKFSQAVTDLIEKDPAITLVKAEVVGLTAQGAVQVTDSSIDEPYAPFGPAQAIIVASGPLTSESLAGFMQSLTGQDHMAFYDAAAPVVMADSLDHSRVFSQSRYEDEGQGDYLNAPFDKEEYEAFITELVDAQRVIKRDFEGSDLFQACQPIEEIARKGFDAPRFGPLKPVGLTDPATGRRPWAVVQLRAEDAHKQSFNLVGFQTNLTFPEQKRVFQMIPGLEHAEFARYGVMHRNTFIDAPHLLTSTLRLITDQAKELPVPVFVAGQFGGTEGYCEAIASGLYASLAVAACVQEIPMHPLPKESAFGALIAYATNEDTVDYQPMHVNFGIMEPLDPPVRNKRQRYAAYAERGACAMSTYVDQLCEQGLMDKN
ncbi:MAG: methylenetetrahydrofolate--tRNA-(uracil(54)-C(5))-methyltransferase (FADH(2)-oxidizing) TrmFO [Eggerthellaceae bacterium]